MAQTIFITGASSGIGLAAARHFADQGWNVAATMRHPAAGAELAARPNVLVTRLDVEDHPSIAPAVAAALDHFGRVDVLLNNAGYGQYGLFEAASREQIRRQFDVNVFGVMDVTRALLPHFRQNRRGVIINVSSGAGLFTLPLISLYCASKFALEGFSEALAYELASQRIVVKLVEPHGGVTATHFSERSEQDRARDPALADYDAYAARVAAAFAGMTAARTTSAADVAKVIYTAATDGTDRLRYLIGNDTRGFIKAWDELPNSEYVAFMRARFPAEA